MFPPNKPSGSEAGESKSDEKKGFKPFTRGSARKGRKHGKRSTRK